MNQEELCHQMDLLAEDARQRTEVRNIHKVTHTNTVTTIYEMVDHACWSVRLCVLAILKGYKKEIKSRRDLTVVPPPRRRRRRMQCGGLLSLLAMAILTLMAAGKAMALGGVAGTAGPAVKKTLRKKTMRGYKNTVPPGSIDPQGRG